MWYLDLPHATVKEQHCRHFIPYISYQIFQLLQSLTCKGVVFQWTNLCQETTDLLIKVPARLMTAPVVAKLFVLVYAAFLFDLYLYGQSVIV